MRRSRVLTHLAVVSVALLACAHATSTTDGTTWSDGTSSTMTWSEGTTDSTMSEGTWSTMSEGTGSTYYGRGSMSKIYQMYLLSLESCM